MDIVSSREILFNLTRNACGDSKCSIKLFAQITSKVLSEKESPIFSAFAKTTSNPFFFAYSASSLVVVMPILPLLKNLKYSPKQNGLDVVLANAKKIGDSF